MNAIRRRAGIVYSVRRETANALRSNLESVWAIVLMYGGEDVTVACVDSLLKQNYPSLTVLLVDNASPDGSGERVRARFPNIEYLNTGANLGYTGGNNRGIRYALDQGAAYVFIVNNDTTVDSSCVSLLVDGTKRGERAGIVSPKILYHADPSRIWYAGGDFSMIKAVGDHRRQRERDTPDESARLESVTFATGCAFLMPAEVARQLSGFAEDFFLYCEDAELSLRAQVAGYKLYYQPAARVMHHDSLVTHPTPNQIRLRDRNRRRLVRRHYGVLDRLRFAAWFYPTRLVRFAAYLMRADWSRARAIVSGAIER